MEAVTLPTRWAQVPYSRITAESRNRTPAAWPESVRTPRNSRVPGESTEGFGSRKQATRMDTVPRQVNNRFHKTGFWG